MQFDNRNSGAEMSRSSGESESPEPSPREEHPMQRDLDCLEEEEARGAAACEDGELTHGSDTQTAQPKLLSEGTIVLIKENARNKAGRGAKFLGEQAVVVGNASGMGGWHFLTCSDGTLLKLQRNALEVVELPTDTPRTFPACTSEAVERQHRHKRADPELQDQTTKRPRRTSTAGLKSFESGSALARYLSQESAEKYQKLYGLDSAISCKKTLQEVCWTHFRQQQAIPDSKVVGLLRKVNMVLRKQRSQNDADQ